MSPFFVEHSLWILATLWAASIATFLTIALYRRWNGPRSVSFPVAFQFFVKAVVARLHAGFLKRKFHLIAEGLLTAMFSPKS